MRKRMLLTIPMLFLVGKADAAQKACVVLQGDGFSDNHTGAAITGNWADLAFAFDSNNNITGGTGAIYLCDDDNNAVADNPPCSYPIIIDVLLTPDTTGANPNSYWVTSDSYPGWGYTTTTTKATKTVPASSTTVIGGKSGIVARFSLDSDSDLVVAKLVDVSYIVGYANLCGQLWNTLGATSGNPVCVLNSDCSQFAAGDVCTGGFCVDPPPVVNTTVALPWFGIASAIQESQGGFQTVNGPSGPACTTDKQCQAYFPGYPALAMIAPMPAGTYYPVCATAAMVASPWFAAPAGDPYMVGGTPAVGTCGYIACIAGNAEECSVSPGAADIFPPNGGTNGVGGFCYNDPNGIVATTCQADNY